MIAIGVMNPKYEVNVGGILRSMGCFEADLLVIEGKTNKKLLKLNSDTQKAWRIIPMIFCDDLQSAIPYDSIPIAVEILPEATCITNFHHPKSAFYIFGGENKTLTNNTISWCKHTIKIPTKYCLNLAMAVTIVLYDRKLKKLKEKLWINQS